MSTIIGGNVKFTVSENREIGKINVDFFNSLRKVMELFDKKRYEDSIKLINEMMINFPKEPTMTYTWATLIPYESGKYEETIELLEEGFNRGAWWSKEFLEVGFEKLRTLSGYDKLVQLSTETEKSLNLQDQVNLFIRIPKNYSPTKKYPLIISLHGRYSNAKDSEMLFLELSQNREVVIASLQSSQIISKSHFVWDNLDKSVSELSNCLDYLTNNYSIDSSNIILAGISQGLDISLLAYFRNKTKIRGILGIIPSVTNFHKEFIENKEPPAIDTKLRICFILGEDDPRFMKTSDTAQVLKDNGAKTKLIICSNTGHYYPKDYASLLQEAFDFIIK